MTARPRRGRTGRTDVRSSLLRVVPEFTVRVVWQARRCSVLRPVVATLIPPGLDLAPHHW
jgi:hypothetical protein